jgi:hypothetical protein
MKAASQSLSFGLPRLKRRFWALIEIKSNKTGFSNQLKEAIY